MESVAFATGPWGWHYSTGLLPFFPFSFLSHQDHQSRVRSRGMRVWKLHWEPGIKKKNVPGSNLGMLEKSEWQSKCRPVSTTLEPEPLPAWPLPGVYTLVYSFCCALLKRKVHQLRQFLLLGIRLSCLTSFYDSILMCETRSKNDCRMLLWGKIDTM